MPLRKHSRPSSTPPLTNQGSIHSIPLLRLDGLVYSKSDTKNCARRTGSPQLTPKRLGGAALSLNPTESAAPLVRSTTSSAIDALRISSSIEQAAWLRSRSGPLPALVGSYPQSNTSKDSRAASQTPGQGVLSKLNLASPFKKHSRSSRKTSVNPGTQPRLSIDPRLEVFTENEPDENTLAIRLAEGANFTNHTKLKSLVGEGVLRRKDAQIHPRLDCFEEDISLVGLPRSDAFFRLPSKNPTDALTLEASAQVAQSPSQTYCPPIGGHARVSNNTGDKQTSAFQKLIKSASFVKLSNRNLTHDHEVKGSSSQKDQGNEKEDKTPRFRLALRHSGSQRRRLSITPTRNHEKLGYIRLQSDQCPGPLPSCSPNRSNYACRSLNQIEQAKMRSSRQLAPSSPTISVARRRYLRRSSRKLTASFSSPAGCNFSSVSNPGFSPTEQEGHIALNSHGTRPSSVYETYGRERSGWETSSTSKNLQHRPPRLGSLNFPTEVDRETPIDVLNTVSEKLSHPTSSSVRQSRVPVTPTGLTRGFRSPAVSAYYSDYSDSEVATPSWRTTGLRNSGEECDTRINFVQGDEPVDPFSSDGTPGGWSIQDHRELREYLQRQEDP